MATSMAAAASSSAAVAARTARCSSCSDWRLSTASAELVERALHRRLRLVPPGVAGFPGLIDRGLELADVRCRRLPRSRGRRCSSLARSASNVAVAESSRILTRPASSSRDSDSVFMVPPFDVGLWGERKTEGGFVESTKTPVSTGVDGTVQVGRSTCASWVREVTPSFTKTLRRWYSTVLVVM